MGVRALFIDAKSKYVAKSVSPCKRAEKHTPSMCGALVNHKMTLTYKISIAFLKNPNTDKPESILPYNMLHFDEQVS